MAMSRDAFLQLMISELESMKDPDGHLHKERNHSINDIFAKLQFDFPVLEDGHLSQLTEYIISLKVPQSCQSFRLSDRFLENIAYISTSPSYGESTRVSGLCESIYLTLPAYLLTYCKNSLEALLDVNSASEMEWNDALFKVKTMFLAASASMLGSRGKDISVIPSLEKESIDGIVRTVTFVIQAITVPTSSHMKSSDTSETLKDYITRSINRLLYSESTVTSDDHATTLGVSLDIVTHLLFLIRDLSSVSPGVGLAAVPVLLDNIMPSLVNATSSTFTRQKEHMLSTILHTQMLMFFFVSQLACGCTEGLIRLGSQGKTKSAVEDAQWMTYRETLVLCLARHMVTIVSLAESITASLTSCPLPNEDEPALSDAKSEKRSSLKMKCQIFDSLSMIAVFVCDHSSDLRGSYNTGQSPVSIEHVFLTSRLLLVLSSLSSEVVEVGTESEPVVEVAKTPGIALEDSDPTSQKTAPVESTDQCMLYFLLDESVQSRYVKIIAKLSLAVQSAHSSAGDGTVTAYVHKLLFPQILRLEFGQPLNMLNESLTCADRNCGKLFTCRSGPLSPFLLAACLGIALQSTLTLSIRIIDRTFLKALSAVFGDAVGANETLLTPADICVAITRYIADYIRALLTKCSIHCVEEFSEELETSVMSIRSSSADGEIELQQRIGLKKHEASKANKYLLGILDNCSEMLRIICSHLLSLVVQDRPPNPSATTALTSAMNLVTPIYSTLLSLYSEVSLSCESAENISTELKFSVEMKSAGKHDKNDVVDVEGCVTEEEEATGMSLVRQKQQDRHQQFDKTKRKSVHALGRTLKVLRGVLEGQRSSKAD